MDQYDVVVVGAGPAGSSAALAARKLGASVLLLDRATFPRDKTCGDGIAPHALAVLAELGVTGVEAGFAPVPALHLVGPSGASVLRKLDRPDYTIPRKVFDARLVDGAVAAGATLAQHTVRVDRRAAWVGGDRRSDLRAYGDRRRRRVLAGSAYARASPRNPPEALALAIRGYAPATGPSVQQIVTAGGTQWPAYAWNFPIGDGCANIGYGEVLRGKTLSREYLLDRLAGLLPEVDTTAATGLRAHHLPLSTHRPIPVGAGCCWPVTRIHWSIRSPARASSTRSCPDRWPVPRRPGPSAVPLGSTTRR